MKINLAYPYPVLADHNDDYNNSFFKVDIDVNDVLGELVIDATFQLQNDEINERIQTNDFVYAVHVECSQTSFRQSYETTYKTMKIKIPTDKLRGKINIHSFIIANNRLTDYTNESLNDWFKDTSITFEKGNLVAIGDAIETTLFEDNLELLNLPSIVNINRSNTNEFMEVETNHDLIMISLPAYEYEQYASHANSLFKQTILSTVIVPTLVHVFSIINEDASDLEDYTWYQVMEKIFDENNLQIEDVGTDVLPALKAAQMILRKPLKSSFEEIEKFHKIRMED